MLEIVIIDFREKNYSAAPSCLHIFLECRFETELQSFSFFDNKPLTNVRKSICEGVLIFFFLFVFV